MRRTNLLLLPVLLGAVLADAAAVADPPARVARLAYLRGSVSYSPAGTDDWARATLNRPVVTGDRLWTEPGARDELQLGNAAVRMDGGALVNVLNMDDQLMQLQLTQGTLGVRVRPGQPAGMIEVDTPNLALTIQQPGHYRITVDPSGQVTTVRIADGQAQAYGPAATYLIGPGQAFSFAGRELRDIRYADARSRDEFDRWSDARDRRAEQAIARRYVSPAVVGYDDLDEYGSWRSVDGVGPVWTPRRVARDWAPYRDGHWAWVSPWGWTWIDDAPWGFAVTHYGRWANFGGSWGWVPGPASAMPVYAPALVMFINAASSPAPRYREAPAVAWFPLAPREMYRPPYPASQRYVTNINVTNTVINQNRITNVYNGANDGYMNRRVNGAVTAVPMGVFAHAQPVRRSARALPLQLAAAAGVAPGAPVQAQRDSMANRLAAGRRPAQAALARPVMVHASPPAAGHPGRGATPGMPAPFESSPGRPDPLAPTALAAHDQRAPVQPGAGARGPHERPETYAPRQMAAMPGPRQARERDWRHEQQARPPVAQMQTQPPVAAGQRGPQPGPDHIQNQAGRAEAHWPAPPQAAAQLEAPQPQQQRNPPQPHLAMPQRPQDAMGQPHQPMPRPQAQAQPLPHHPMPQPQPQPHSPMPQPQPQPHLEMQQSHVAMPQQPHEAVQHAHHAMPQPQSQPQPQPVQPPQPHFGPPPPTPPRPQPKAPDPAPAQPPHAAPDHAQPPHPEPPKPPSAHPAPEHAGHPGNGHEHHGGGPKDEKKN
jgi:hypothetical protein